MDNINSHKKYLLSIDLDSIDLSLLYKGVGETGRTFFGRKMRWEIWYKKQSKMFPLAIIVVSCGGWRHNLEYGEFLFNNDNIVFTREGDVLNIKRNGIYIGHIQYGNMLRWLYWGSAKAFSNNGHFADIRLPLIGPSLGQSSDLFGIIRTVSFGNIKYLLNYGNKVVYTDYRDRWCGNYFSRCPSIDSMPIFPDIGRAFKLNECENIVILIMALWSRMFFTYA